jgi:hypothetical protein
VKITLTVSPACVPGGALIRFIFWLVRNSIRVLLLKTPTLAVTLVLWLEEYGPTQMLATPEESVVAAPAFAPSTVKPTNSPGTRLPNWSYTVASALVFVYPSAWLNAGFPATVMEAGEPGFNGIGMI